MTPRSVSGAGVRVRSAANATRRALRDERGEAVELVGPADGSSLDVHVNELVSARPGPHHRHDRADNFYYVLDGHVRVDLDGRTEDLAPGDAILIPRGLAHSVTVVDGPSARLVEIYAPANPDFILVND